MNYFIRFDYFNRLNLQFFPTSYLRLQSYELIHKT